MAMALEPRGTYYPGCIVLPLFSGEFLRMRRSQTSRRLIRRQCTCCAVNMGMSYSLWWPFEAGRATPSGVSPTPRETATTSQTLRRPNMKFAAFAFAAVLMTTSSDAKPECKLHMELLRSSSYYQTFFLHSLPLSSLKP